LNPVEQVWAYAKSLLRSEHTSCIDQIRQGVDKYTSPSLLPPDLLNKFIEHSVDCVELYAKQEEEHISTGVIHEIMKKKRSHRRALLAEILKKRS
jgi:hypothetical protein